MCYYFFKMVNSVFFYLIFYVFLCIFSSRSLNLLKPCLEIYLVLQCFLYSRFIFFTNLHEFFLYYSCRRQLNYHHLPCQKIQSLQNWYFSMRYFLVTVMLQNLNITCCYFLLFKNAFFFNSKNVLCYCILLNNFYYKNLNFKCC